MKVGRITRESQKKNEPLKEMFNLVVGQVCASSPEAPGTCNSKCAMCKTSISIKHETHELLCYLCKSPRRLSRDKRDCQLILSCSVTFYFQAQQSGSFSKYWACSAAAKKSSASYPISCKMNMTTWHEWSLIAVTAPPCQISQDEPRQQMEEPSHQVA